jgi:hypothetical protein
MRVRITLTTTDAATTMIFRPFPDTAETSSVELEHYTLLAHNRPSTAVTRGRQLVVLVGQPKAINIAIHNDKTDLRYTHLATRLREAITAAK